MQIVIELTDKNGKIVYMTLAKASNRSVKISVQDMDGNQMNGEESLEMLKKAIDIIGG